MRRERVVFFKNRRVWFVGLMIGLGTSIKAQQKIPVTDSTQTDLELDEVKVEAFAQEKRLLEQPVSLSVMTVQDRDKYNPQTIVPAMNAIPGVRMEQRSPGSFRLNIRGSSLRSPFGVRNTKIYYNGVPFTDPGGNTYLNQLSLRDMHQINVFKGPSGSLYGAGTGGVLVINSELFQGGHVPSDNRAEVSFSGGSFNTQNQEAVVRWGKPTAQSMIRFSNTQSEGFRDHTALHHQTLSYETRLDVNEREGVEAFFHYTNLFYQTPGALTAEEFVEDSRGARPAAGIFPSAEESQAAVEQKAFLVGLRHTYQFTPAFKNETALYGAYTDFVNPTFRNYELRKEPHFGGRTLFQYEMEGKRVNGNFAVGGELQQGYFSQKDFGTVEGQPDTLQTIDRVKELTAFVFAQADLQFRGNWEVNIGMSLNHRNLHFQRYFPVGEADFHFKNHPVWAPRLVISKKFSEKNMLFVGVSRGFSPPTIAEILPSTAELNRGLQAEKGMQYEIGNKGSFQNNRIHYEVSAFVTRLNQSISSRKDFGGADYFINAGNALQKGIEASIKANLWRRSLSFVSQLDAWGSLTLFDFKYKDYQVGDEDFSGQRFPGSARTNFAAGLDLETRFDLQAHLTYQRTSRIPLNDANTVFAGDYDLLGFQLAYPFRVGRKLGVKIFVGGENLLDQTYSLGEDINAFGGRYFNRAPGINFNGGVHFIFDI